MYPTRFYYEQLLKAGETTIKNYPAYNRLYMAYKNLTLGNYTDVYQKIRENVVKVTVNYGDLTYTVIEESPEMTIEDLFGKLLLL